MIHRQDKFKQNSRPNISLLTELTCRGIPKFSETVFLPWFETTCSMFQIRRFVL